MRVRAPGVGPIHFLRGNSILVFRIRPRVFQAIILLVLFGLLRWFHIIKIDQRSFNVLGVHLIDPNEGKVGLPSSTGNAGLGGCEGCIWVVVPGGRF